MGQNGGTVAEGEGLGIRTLRGGQIVKSVHFVIARRVLLLHLLPSRLSVCYNLLLKLPITRIGEPRRACDPPYYSCRSDDPAFERAQIAQRLLPAYKVDGGRVHLAGCTLEDRLLARLTYCVDGQPLDRYVDADGQPLDAADIEALGLTRSAPWRSRRKRERCCGSDG